MNGGLRIDFPITVQGELTSRRGITTTLGSGGPPVRVRTTNGGVKINAARSGTRSGRAGSDAKSWSESSMLIRCQGLELDRIADRNLPVVQHFAERTTAPRHAHRLLQTRHGGFHLLAGPRLAVDANADACRSSGSCRARR